MLLELQQIPGPRFLLLFPLLALAVVMVARVLLSLLGDRRQPLPEPGDLPPNGLAALFGDTPWLIKTVLFSLWHHNIIELVKATPQDGVDDYLVRRVADAAPPETRGGQLIYRYLSRERKRKELLEDPQLRHDFTVLREHWRNRGTELGLVRSTLDRRIGYVLSLLAISAAYGPAITKLILGLSRDKPVAFLVIEMIIILPCMLVGLRTLSALTPNGNRYLKRCRHHFAWLKRTIEPTGLDPTYGMALFGIGLLGGGSLFDPFRQAFPGGIVGHGDSNGGCSGDSGCSGGCDGGCGGGCGGCGGD
ncbi:MAG: hypothetical protein C0624_01805 [Desulfuromonas sp.]|nr:MAG: hypothetical protein C0624_01805 [Desulfuromonas sp.]